MSEHRLNCPFCGDNNLLWVLTHISCLSCGAKGPSSIKMNSEDATARWNTRAQPITKEKS